MHGRWLSTATATATALPVLQCFRIAQVPPLSRCSGFLTALKQVHDLALLDNCQFLFWPFLEALTSFLRVDQWLAMSSAPLGRVLKNNWQEGNLLLAEVQSRHEICQKKLHNQPKQFFNSFTLGVSKSCTSAKIMKENALFSGKIYTAGFYTTDGCGNFLL